MKVKVIFKAFLSRLSPGLYKSEKKNRKMKASRPETRKKYLFTVLAK